MIKLRLNVENVKQQLFECDMTELMRYINSLQETAVDTVFEYSEVKHKVFDLELRFNLVNLNVSVIIWCDVFDGEWIGTEEGFCIASMDFAKGVCETKSMLTDNIKVEFI